MNLLNNKYFKRILISFSLLASSTTFANYLEQMISVNNTPEGVLGRTTVLEVAYDTTDNNNQLSGLGMRVHFDSSLLSFKEITGLMEQDIIVDGQGPFSDDTDFDNDPLTDQYMLFGWASLYNNWPNTELPAVLMNIAFDVSENIDTNVISSTNINFTDTSFTAGYEFSAESYELEILNATWDFDGNGQADALTDGLMMLRHLFGLRGDLVINDAMAGNSPFDSQQVVAEIEAAMDIADIDADGELNALTDGLLLLRYLFDLRDDLLTNGVVGPDATRSSNTDIQNYLESHMPNRVSDLNTAYSQTIIDFDDLNDPVSGYEYSNLGVIFSTESVGLITGHNGRITSGDWYQPLNIKFVNPDNNSLDATARNISIENPLEEDNMILYAYDLGGNLIETQSIQGAGIINFSEYGIHKIILDASETAFVMDNLSFLIE